MTTTTDDVQTGWMTETWATTSATSAAAADNMTDVIQVEFDVDFYLEQHLGYRHRSTGEAVSLTVVYLLTDTSRSSPLDITYTCRLRCLLGSCVVSFLVSISQHLARCIYYGPIIIIM